MDIKTEEQQITTIRFFNDEVRHYINHPSDLAAALTRATGIVASQIVIDEHPVKVRKAKQVKPVKHTSNWATDGYAGHTSRAKKATPKKVDKRKLTGETVECPGCGEPFARQGLGPHKRGCAPYQLKKAAEAGRASAA